MNASQGTRTGRCLMFLVIATHKHTPLTTRLQRSCRCVGKRHLEELNSTLTRSDGWSMNTHTLTHSGKQQHQWLRALSEVWQDVAVAKQPT